MDTERKRISLTAKKTLVQSTLPILSKNDDIKIGIVTYAVVFKASPVLMVEFYNNLKAIVPARELGYELSLRHRQLIFEVRSETSISNPSEAFPIGKIVKVRIIKVEAEQSRIIASIRQAAPNFVSPVVDISGIDVGDTVQGEIAEIHKENIILKLKPTEARALLSSKNLANHRGIPLAQLNAGLKVGEELDGLIVVSRVPDKSFVIVANKPQMKSALPSKSSLTIESVTVGQTIMGRVTHHSPQGTLLKINSHLGGLLHPTDTSDDYDAAKAFPSIDSIIKATVIDMFADKKRLVLSTRSSRMLPNKVSDIVDREVKGLEDLQIGDVVRGFIKSVTEHGLFVAIARGVDARVQIKELFDEVRRLTGFLSTH